MYYLHTGGPDTAAAVSAPYLLVGAVTAMWLLPAASEPAPAAAAESPRQAAIAAVTHVLTGLFFLVVLVASFLRADDSPWWMIGFTAAMWCTLVSKALTSKGRDWVATGTAAFCGLLHLPAVVLWFDPLARGISHPDVLALITVGLYALIVAACLYLSAPPAAYDPPSGELPPHPEPRPSRAGGPNLYRPGHPVAPPDAQVLIRSDVTP